jgi:hypothetical protein
MKSFKLDLKPKSGEILQDDEEILRGERGVEPSRQMVFMVRKYREVNQVKLGGYSSCKVLLNTRDRG